METAGRSSRSTKRRRLGEEKTRGDRSDWHRAKGRAEGWALFTRPQAAAITLLGELIQAPSDFTAQNVSEQCTHMYVCVCVCLLLSPCREMFCCIFPQRYPWGVSLH